MKSTASLRTFYTLILTQVFSLIGSRMTSLAIGIKVFSDTNQATPLALTAFFSTLPSLISASVAGVFADRWNRRYMMILADIGQAVGTVILLVSFLTGTFELWLLYVVTFIQAFFGTFQSPAFDASITMLVPDEHRDRANAIQQLAGPASGIVAPMLAGLLFAVVGVTGVMVIDLVTFSVAVLVVLLIHIPHPEQTEEGRAMRTSVWRDVLTGFRYLRTRQILFAVALYVSLVNFLIGGSMALNTPYILTITGSETTLGTLLSVMSAGAIVGGVIMSAWGGTRPRIHTIMPGIGLAGVCLAIYGLGRSPLALGATLFLLMLPLPMVNASFMSMIQAKVPPDLQGRVFAALSQVSLGLMPIALMLIGPLADRVFEPAVGGPGWDVVAPLVGSERGAGMGLIFFIAGSLMFLLTIAVYSRRSVREMEATLPDYAAVARANEPPAAEEVPVAFAAD
jgi:MFS family permease